MMREELALTADLRAPRWHKDDVNPDKPFKVVIIGAGMSGIVAAYRLAEADVPYIVVDKNADVGGTWLENSYPGCRVDIPNHYYSYSFAQRDDWPLYYSPRAELYKYFRECVDEFGIRPNIRFNTEVSSVEYDDETATWTVQHRRQGRQGVQPPGQRRDQRRRPAQPAAAAEHRGPRVVRRPGVPLGPLGPRRRPHRQARRRHRHRLQRRPVRPDRRRAGRAPGDLPAHAELDVPGAALPPRGAAGLPVPARARAVLPPVVPLLAVLEVGRAAPPDGRGRSGLARQDAVGRRGQRPAAPAAHRGARGAVPGAARPAGEGAAAVPAGGQADHRRRRHVGGDAAPRQRHADLDGHREDRPRGRRHRRRRAPRVRRAALRHRASSRRSSSRR